LPETSASVEGIFSIIKFCSQKLGVKRRKNVKALITCKINAENGTKFYNKIKFNKENV